MSKSVWGVEHGVEISKRDGFTRREKTAGALSMLNPIAGGAYAGSKAKKGKGAKVGVRAGGRGLAESTAGGAAGSLIGSLATRGSQGGSMLGAGAGALGGAYHGTGASMRNSRRKGWTKGSKG